jgi:phosphatidylglycerol:prolipoprotein diacylglycerol transferase
VGPIPILFQVGPIQIHTYGIGLALTFIFGWWYMRRRVRAAGLDDRWVADAVFWVMLWAIVGAHVVHVIANHPFYMASPGEILMVWHGGLSSFGGLALGIPAGLWVAHKRCPQLSIARALDLAAPVLALGWGIGRLLGPQLMIRGGGKITSAWYGMYYAGEAGRRVPVPIFQALECFAVFGLVILYERTVRDRPDGALIAATAMLWGLARFFDQYLWLGVPGQLNAVEVGGLLLACGGLVSLVLFRARSGTTAAAHQG